MHTYSFRHKKLRGNTFVHLLLFNILVSHLYEMNVYGDHGKMMRLSPRKSTKSIGMNVEQVRNQNSQSGDAVDIALPVQNS